MKATDLMVGDWVYNSHHKKVIQITPYDFFTHSHINGVQSFDGIPNPKPTLGIDLEPVPLTEEILEANGFFKYNPFKTIDYKMYAFPEQCNIKKERGFGIEIGNGAFYITDHCLMPIRYVHEIQHALRLCCLHELADNFKVE